MALEARVQFTIKNVCSENGKFPRINFAKLGKNKGWKIKKKLIDGDCWFELPGEGRQVYGLNPNILSYKERMYEHNSLGSMFSLISEGYSAARKILGRKFKLENDIGLIFEGEETGGVKPELISSIEDVGRRLFSTYELQVIDDSNEYIHAVLRPKLRESLGAYFYNSSHS